MSTPTREEEEEHRVEKGKEPARDPLADTCMDGTTLGSAKDDSNITNDPNGDDTDDERLPLQADPGEEDAGAPLITIVCKWRGKSYPLTVPETATVGDVKLLLEAETDVLVMRQKILGLCKGRLPSDDTRLSSLGAIPAKFTLMGTPEDAIVLDPSEIDDLPEVVDDLSWDYRASNASEVRFRPEVQLKLQRRIRRSKVNVIHPLRPGKKLCVLDLDYTLFDMKGAVPEGGSMHDLKRPFMDDFLASAYEDYDLVIWSQTSWMWLEAKLTSLGILSSERYKIAFVLDKSFMFSIRSKVKGKEREHEVKALEIVWSKFPQFSAKNTIHVDDLARNGALNPQSLLRIKAYKDYERARHVDRDLAYLTAYLKLINRVDDFTTLNHDEWKDYCRKH